MLMLGMTLFVACSDDDDTPSLNQLTVHLNSTDATATLSDFTVTVTEARSGEVYATKADATGNALFSLPYGQYAVTAEDSVNGGATMFGTVTSFTFSSDNTTCNVDLHDIMSSLEKSFVLNELNFNCSSNGSWDYNYYEEYFTITNVSDRPLYADGLAFAVCGDYNAVDDDGIKSAYLGEDSIVVSQLYTIPGSGREHLVQPGASIVIAHSAIDHTEGGTKTAAIDLSGADFEIYVPYEYSMTTDNPEVPNLTVDYSMFQAFSWNYGGAAPLMLLRPTITQAERQSYVENHLRLMKVTGAYGNMQQQYLIIPTSWIVDGVETGSKDNLLHKVLPVSVDKSSILIDDTGLYGGFKGQFVQRKPASTGYLQDTNDSENDFVVVPNGAKSYPKN